jgi:hypothetical protein
MSPDKARSPQDSGSEQFLKLKSALSAMEEALSTSGSGDAVTTEAFNAIQHIWGQSDVFSLLDIERELRRMDSRIYLIAAPLDAYEAGLSTGYPEDFKPGEEPRYTLVIADGIDGAVERLMQYSTSSPVENMARLDETGMLVNTNGISG